MNLPLFLPGILDFIVICLAAFAAAAITIYLLKYKFKYAIIRKCLTIFVLVVAGLAITYIMFYTISNAVGRAKVKDQLAKMRVQGFVLTKDAIFPKMPEKGSDNGAFFYKSAFGLMRASSSYQTLLDIEYSQQTYDISNWSEQAVTAAEQQLKTPDIKLLLSLFRRGAEKPYAVYEREYRWYETEQQKLIAMRALFRLISIKSSSDGLNGTPDTGYSLICDGFKTVKQFETEPCLITQLVNIHCATLNIDAMNTLLSRCGINRQNAEQLLIELDKLDFKTGMGHARDGDTLMFREIFEKFMTGHKFDSAEKEMIMEKIEFYDPPLPKKEMEIENLIFLFSAFFNIEKEMVIGRLDFLLSVWPFFYQDYAYFLKHEARIKALYSKPYWALEKEIQELKDESSNIPAQYLISPILFETYTLIFNRTKVARIESEIDAAKLTLALHIYKNKNGAFPDKLEQLAPGILKEIPVDPISGKPFEYQKTNDKFTLSSVWLKEKTEQDRKEQNRREQERRKRNIQK